MHRNAMTDSIWDKIRHDQNAMDRAEKLSKAYLDARNTFKTEADDNPFLKGNDNFIGRIAEMLVIQHFMRDASTHSIHRPQSKSNKGADLMLNYGRSDEQLISVKCITHENSRGRSSEVVLPDGIELHGVNEKHSTVRLSILLVQIEEDLSYFIYDVTQGNWQSRKSRYITATDVEGASPLCSGSLAL